ncbi:MAG: hypothetical protein ACRYGL_10315 [Janthinobacterium lividum]
MSSIPRLDSVSRPSASASPRATSGFRGFLRNAWASYVRHAELQVMLSSGYSEGLSRQNRADGSFTQRRVTIPLR